VLPEGLGKFKKNHLIGYRSRDLPVCFTDRRVACKTVEPLTIANFITFVVGLGTMPQIGKSNVRISMRSLDFLDLLNSSSRIMALGSTQPLTQMSTRNVP
jgi:hypothetical protein